jgi:hypothetical protein
LCDVPWHGNYLANRLNVYPDPEDIFWPDYNLLLVAEQHGGGKSKSLEGGMLWRSQLKYV